MFQPIGYLCYLQLSGSWRAGLKCYFLSLGKEDCPDTTWRVMCKRAADAAAESSDEDEVTVSECVLLFLHNVMQEFHCVILKLENESATLLDIHEVMSRLRSQLILRRADRFYGHKTKQATRNNQSLQHGLTASLKRLFCTLRLTLILMIQFYLKLAVWV